MLEKFTVNTISSAINDIIIPKFEKYLEDRRNDISLQERIDEVVDKIDGYELLVNELTEKLEPDFKFGIMIGQYEFRYDKDLNMYVYNGVKSERARSEVLSADGLYVMWTTHQHVRTRIAAIVATLDETSFDEMLKIVESQIDFNEFITKQ